MLLMAVIRFLRVRKNTIWVAFREGPFVGALDWDTGKSICLTSVAISYRARPPYYETEVENAHSKIDTRTHRNTHC